MLVGGDVVAQHQVHLISAATAAGDGGDGVVGLAVGVGEDESIRIGVFHPHADKHHIKKENIGLIEVMGLAVLPSRLKKELTALAEQIVAGSDIHADEVLNKHADWVDELKQRYTFTADNAMDIILKETGNVFSHVLEDAGVYKCTPEGRAAFHRFIDTVNHG